MASITIRRLEESTKQRLRVEEEARQILRAALSEQAATGLNLAESRPRPA
jgi:plasmid stability protein